MTGLGDKRVNDAFGELTHLRAEHSRLLAALWDIRMAAERGSINDPPWALPNEIITMALMAIGPEKERAQEAAALKRKHPHLFLPEAPSDIRSNREGGP